MRKIYIILLAVAVALACKKDKEQPPVMEQEANTELDATVDGQKYTPLTAAITPEFYTEPTQSIGALKIQANLNTSKSLVIFIDQLQNGVINLTQSYPAQMGLESHKGNEMKILGDNTGDKILATTLKSYVKYIDATTSYFAISGKITVVIKDKNTLITWEVTFKDSTGKSFVSTGSTTIINYKKNTKSTSQITSPTNALSVAAISPDYAWEGTVVTLTGTGFSAIDTENLILFGGQSVKATKTTTNQLQFTIPYFTNINKPTIEVKVLGNTATLDGFTFLPQIHSFTPAKAPVGNTVQIFGLAFPINAAELVVKFGDVVAEVKENNHASVKVVVPPNAKTGKISVSYKGKTDVWSATDFEVATTPAGGVNSVPIGRSFAGAAAVDFTNKNAVVDYFAGEHPVAIYKTPTGGDAEIGKGKLIISRSGVNFTMKLVGPSGSTLSEATVDLTNDKDYNYETLTKAGNAYIVSAKELTTKSASIDMTSYGNGFLKGEVYANAKHAYSFRNNVEYFGLTPPPAIVALAGVWKGDHIVTNKCQPNIVSTTIGADGTITLNGKDNVDCSVETFTQKWDGQDDFVEPNAVGFRSVNVGSMIYLDASKGGGASGGGSIWVLVPQLANPTSILEVLGNVGGYNGILLTEFPKKQ